jgi:hypothetical protein
MNDEQTKKQFYEIPNRAATSAPVEKATAVTGTTVRTSTSVKIHNWRAGASIKALIRWQSSMANATAHTAYIGHLC